MKQEHLQDHYILFNPMPTYAKETLKSIFSILEAQ